MKKKKLTKIKMIKQINRKQNNQTNSFRKTIKSNSQNLCRKSSLKFKIISILLLLITLRVENVPIKQDVYQAMNFVTPIFLCPRVTSFAVIGMWIKMEANFAYNIQPAAVMQFLNHGGHSRYALYNIGTKSTAHCYETKTVLTGPAGEQKRYKFITVLVTPFQETPGQFKCKISQVFAPLNTASGGVDLVPCLGLVSSYKFIDDYFVITKNSIPQNFASFELTSIMTIPELFNIRIQQHMPFYMEITKPAIVITPLVPGDNFDDEFVEMLVLGPALGSIFAWKSGMYTDNKFLYDKPGQAIFDNTQPAMKGSDFLERISLKGRSGYHLLPDSSQNFDSYAMITGLPLIYHHSRWFKAHFYLTNPSALTGSRIVVIDVAQRATGIREYKHQIRIRREAINPSKLRFSLYDTETATTLKTSFTLDYFSDKRWIHFGIIIGEGLLYYKAVTNEGVFKFQETLFAMHADATSTAPLNRKVSVVSEYKTMPMSYFKSGAAITYLFAARLTTYQNINLTPPADTADLYQVLLYDFNVGEGVILWSPETSSVVHDDPQNRCIVPGHKNGICLAFAFMYYFFDATLNQHDSSTHYTIFTGGLLPRPVGPEPNRGCNQNCLFCFEENNCLVPKTGYNRELTTNQVEHMAKKNTLLSVFEGGDEREGRVRFQRSTGEVYWVKCPPGCKRFNSLVGLWILAQFDGF